ncbi:hypothetical protein DL96DRAFT_126673 [Flagelloscypha sp. PMI_526]|nr:hypothetical protein DL96DRAFT_126673 [Flagelloscypha sp. PMI_526]
MKTPSKMGPFDRSNAPTPSTIFTRTPDYPDTPRRGRDPFETPFRSRVIPNRMGSPVKTASPLKKMMNFDQPDVDDTWVGGGKDDAWLSLVAEVGEVVLRLGLVRTAQCERRASAPSDCAGGDQEEKREEGRTTRSRSRSRSRSRPPPPTPVVCTSEEASELLWIKEQSALLALQCDELGPGDVKVLGELCKGIHCLCGVGITEAEGLDAKSVFLTYSLIPWTDHGFVEFI